MQVVSGRKVAVDWAVPTKEFAASKPQKAAPGLHIVNTSSSRTRSSCSTVLGMRSQALRATFDGDDLYTIMSGSIFQGHMRVSTLRSVLIYILTRVYER